jgi:hypothetical protein
LAEAPNPTLFFQIRAFVAIELADRSDYAEFIKE